MLTPGVVLASSQKALSHSIDTHSTKLHHNRMVDERGKARMNSLAMQHAGDCLNTVPVRALGLHLRPREFTVADKYRLGVRVYPEAGPVLFVGKTVTPMETMLLVVGRRGRGSSGTMFQAGFSCSSQGAVSPPTRVPGQACRCFPSWLG